MNPKEAYLQGQINTASPGSMIIMLYDGLLRFSNEAKAALTPGQGDQYEAAANAVKRATDILTELNSSLRPDVYPELCKNLSGLYSFFMEQLSKALKEQNPQPIQEILPLIEDLRNTWKEADATTASQKSPQA